MKLVVLTLFSGLLVFFLGCRIAFVIHLVSRQVSFNFFLMGTPGYLERRYVAWCAENNESPQRWLLLQRIGVTCVVGAAILAFLTFSRLRGQP